MELVDAKMVDWLGVVMGKIECNSLAKRLFIPTQILEINHNTSRRCLLESWMIHKETLNREVIMGYGEQLLWFFTEACL